MTQTKNIDDVLAKSDETISDFFINHGYTKEQVEKIYALDESDQITLVICSLIDDSRINLAKKMAEEMRERYSK
ncbi:MAG: hypothetical protein ACE5RM_03145 [Candidatus Nitrosomaritimum aestuariumsis]